MQGMGDWSVLERNNTKLDMAGGNLEQSFNLESARE